MAQIAELFIMFFKIGAFTFGGGYAMLPLIQQEISGRGLMSADKLLGFIAVSESTPGPFAVNIATYVGMHVAGVWGSAAATLGVVTPSFIIILLVARAYDRFNSNRFVKAGLSGLRPAVAGLLASALFSLSKAVFSASALYSGGIFAAAALLWFKKTHPIVIILVSAALGLALGCMGAYN